jgi:hypothetical protein
LLAAPCTPQSECTTPSFVYFRDDGEHIDSDGPTAPPWTPFFIYFRDDGEHIDSDDPTAPPWTQFEVALKDEMSQPLADDVKIRFLLAAISSDPKLLSQYSATQQMYMATGNSNTPSFVYFRDDGEHIDSDGPTAPPWTPFFVYFRNDGKHIDSDGPTAPPWTQFEVTLKDENGNHRLDSKGDPITVIAPPPSELQGRVFLTKTDEHGDIKYTSYEPYTHTFVHYEAVRASEFGTRRNLNSSIYRISEFHWIKYSTG